MADEFTKAALYGIKTFNEKVKEKVKEEIGMLIELANQYEKEKEKSEGVDVEVYVEFEWEWTGEGYLNKGLTRFDRTDQWEGDNLYKDVAVAYLISKSYGFIGWLVENDKIDTSNLNLKVFKSMFSNDGTVEISYEELILMLLAISDEPIEFLCEIIKN